MEGERENVGLSVFAAGVAIVVVAVLLFGVTTGTGAVDWVSIVAAIAGAVMAVGGLYIMSRKGGTRGTPHSAS